MILVKKITASSLLETMIAMVIIMLVFGISTMIFVNVTSGNFSLQKRKADLLIKQALIQTKEQKAYVDETLDYDLIKIDRHVTNYPDTKDILMVSFVAYHVSEDSTHAQYDTLAQMNHLILVKPNE
jgi:hypothetical protein